ncbi:hypothetical protein [Seleniivibrio woodruffii]|uniref:hypothetical protein n=1 Tax=Seleniivibrio woodruffii TaxID=1078050 RepID=UPI002409F02D|nr:hypothetical protein [Seleniivibrio woodruffii]
MVKFVLLTLISLTAAACTVKYEVPYQDIPVSELPAVYPAQKLGIKASLLPMDAKVPSQKVLNNGSGIEQLIITPMTQQINKAAKDTMPLFFAETAEVQTPSADRGLIISPELQDYDFNTTVRGFSTCGVAPKINLRIHFMDNSGREIYRSDTVSSVPVIEGNCMDSSGMSEIWNRQIYKAAADALAKGFNGMTGSYALNSYLSGAQSAAPQPAPKFAPEGVTDKDRLRAAFESGAIDAAQLKRAIDELGGERSKLLDSFLKGNIDPTKFGELY